MTSPDVSSPDAELIARCRRHDEDAWRALVRRYESSILGIAAGYGLAADECHDVAQETFFALLRSLPDLESPENISSWIGTTGRRTCLKRLRAKRIHEERAGAAWPQPEPSITDNHAEVLERRAHVHAALDRLPRRCRDILLRLYGPNPQDYRRVSEELGIPPGSIGPTRGRCLEKLRRLLEPDAGA